GVEITAVSSDFDMNVGMRRVELVHLGLNGAPDSAPHALPDSNDRRRGFLILGSHTDSGSRKCDKNTQHRLQRSACHRTTSAVRDPELQSTKYRHNVLFVSGTQFMPGFAGVSASLVPAAPAILPCNAAESRACSLMEKA